MFGHGGSVAQSYTIRQATGGVDRMKPAAPHFLLFASAQPSAADRPGRWHFALQPLDGGGQLEACDEEPQAGCERLELWAVVRGLEALEQPSRVTLVTTSRLVDRGLRHALEQWRSNRWRWEAYGRLVEIKNADLWQRIDRALQFHQVECRILRVDPPQRAPTCLTARRPRRAAGLAGTLGRWWLGLGAASRRWCGHPIGHAAS